MVYPNFDISNYIFRSFENLSDNIKAVVYLRQENIIYKRKNQELVDKLNNYSVISQEYENLLKLLKLTKTKDNVSIFAKISAREPSEWYQWMIIDKGKNDGLYNELPVAMFNKNYNTLCAVGRIIETYKTSSKVALITNSISMLPVEVKDKGIKCLAEGFGSNLLKITYIALEADIKSGDKIVVSELSSVFQKGMLVGTVKDVIKESSTDFKTAIAEVFFETNTIYDAIILIPRAEVK
jgi:rod shape-determining protein MreC